MAISYDYYRIFYHVAESHSFTKAAEILGNNQPNITRCMNVLEQQLGCKLFIRSNRGIRLTPEGEKLFYRVSAAFEQLRLGEEEIERDCSLETGTISIGVSDSAMHLLLIDKLSAFHEQYPGVHLRISNDTVPQTIAGLIRNSIDYALVNTPISISSPLKAVNLLPFKEVLICGSKYKELASKPRHLSEILPYSFICLRGGTSAREFYQKLFFEHDLRLRVDMEVFTSDQILPMVKANLGVGFFPEAVAEEAIKEGDIYKVDIIEHIPERFICLIEDTSRPQSIAMKAMRDMILETQQEAEAQGMDPQDTEGHNG